MPTKKNLVIEINSEIRDALIEEGAQDAYKCYQCGKCSSVCPWFQVGTYEFPVHRLGIETLLGLLASSEEKEELAREVDRIYRCVGCEACIEQCPLGVNIPAILRAARRILVDFGSYPDTLKSVVQKLKNVGNPLGEPPEKRGDWARPLDLKYYNQEMEYLYFPCCIPAYDSRLQNVARSTAQLLRTAGVSFGILGEKENCCGEALRRIGAEKVYQELAKRNIELFRQNDVKKVITTSPHCYTTFKNEYPEFGGEFEIFHITQILARLLAEGKIVPGRRFEKKVVYHDPCTLGRQNGIYEEPRAVLRSIPGLELLEVEEFCRNLSLCCGAGGGALWQDWDKDERIADVRVNQLLETGAEVIAVACPYCLQMFEETLKSMGREIPVLAVSEILYEVTK